MGFDKTDTNLVLEILLKENQKFAKATFARTRNKKLYRKIKECRQKKTPIITVSMYIKMNIADLQKVIILG